MSNIIPEMTESLDDFVLISRDDMAEYTEKTASSLFFQLELSGFVGRFHLLRRFYFWSVRPLEYRNQGASNFQSKDKSAGRTESLTNRLSLPT